MPILNLVFVPSSQVVMLLQGGSSTVSNGGPEEARSNLVAISGVSGTLALLADPLIESYEKALRNSGYNVELLSNANNDGGHLRNKRKRSTPATTGQNFTHAAILCLQGRCLSTSAHARQTRVRKLLALEPVIDVHHQISFEFWGFFLFIR